MAAMWLVIFLCLAVLALVCPSWVVQRCGSDSQLAL